MANLASGCIAITCLLKDDFVAAFWMVCLGIFFDFFDGFFARLLKVTSDLGLQLDSLADMVTSGVVPGLVMFLLMKQTTTNEYLPLLGFIITLGSAYRLAKFNIDTRQADQFIGLPTPANALWVSALPWFVMQSVSPLSLWLNQYTILLVLSVLSAFLLNAEIPLFSLKVKEFQLKKLIFPILFLVTSLAGLLLYGVLAVPLIIFFYVLLSVIKNQFFTT
jgi:CDP-diacylglycerol--serine O-phosphatidyltransferase